MDLTEKEKKKYDVIKDIIEGKTTKKRSGNFFGIN